MAYFQYIPSNTPLKFGNNNDRRPLNLMNGNPLEPTVKNASITMDTIPLSELFTFPQGDVDVIITLDGQKFKGKVYSKLMALASPVWRKFLFPPFPRLPKNENDKNANEENWSNKSTNNNSPSNDDDGQVSCTQRNKDTQDQDIEAHAKSDQATCDCRAPVPDLDFTEDDSDILLLLFQIAHYQFDKVPECSSLDELIGIGMLCDDYDCAKLYAPWAKRWMRDNLPPWRSLHIELVHSLEWHKLEEYEAYIFITWIWKDCGFIKFAEELVCLLRSPETDPF
ncbi:hypothetical protein HYALB_00001609 [Hymenoscyphus albidus]|uniref:BTB domain-containing protein n=1 Tax=Hymenoscyphus albidus TaxID=595503 RepID=A0A9N9LFU2_9HELO|nr:hypothetical protein HYALB_00001609 [Hymenoscyphus albidus]